MPHHILKNLAAPLIILVFFLSLYAVWLFLDLPPEETLIQVATGFFEKYGLWTVLISAILEGLLLIGWYFPGTLVVVLALILAGEDVVRVAQVGALAATGLLVGYVMNFAAGKYGWYRLLVVFGLQEPLERARNRLTKYGLGAIFMSYWQPNLGSVVSTSAGILQFPFGKFLSYSLVAVMLWMTFWSVLIYFLGRAALSLVGVRLILIAIAIWIVSTLVFRRKSKLIL